MWWVRGVLHDQTHVASFDYFSPWCHQVIVVVHTKEPPSVWCWWLDGGLHQLSQPKSMLCPPVCPVCFLPYLQPHASAPFLVEHLLPRILLCSEWISWWAASLSISCQKWEEHSGPHPLLFITCVGVRQSQKGCSGQSSELTRPPGRGLCGMALRGLGTGKCFKRLQMARVPGWQTVGGSFLCIPNRLRIFFYPLKLSGRKWGQGEWQA